MAERNNWTREQTMMAFALYRILPSGKWDQHNLTIQKLANHIHRSPSAVVFKLGNLASLDENRMTKGLTNHSKLDQKYGTSTRNAAMLRCSNLPSCWHRH